MCPQRGRPQPHDAQRWRLHQPARRGCFSLPPPSKDRKIHLFPLGKQSLHQAQVMEEAGREKHSSPAAVGMPESHFSPCVIPLSFIFHLLLHESCQRRTSPRSSPPAPTEKQQVKSFQSLARTETPLGLKALLKSPTAQWKDLCQGIL